jgi:hypothetical protein
MTKLASLPLLNIRKVRHQPLHTKVRHNLLHAPRSSTDALEMAPANFTRSYLDSS